MDDELYETALTAIKAVWEDDSVDKDETRRQLQGLKDEIDVLIDTL